MKTTTILATSWRRSKMKLPTCFCLLGLLSAQVVHGELVDVFIATGQSNATWPNDTYEFGQGVQAELTASGLYSNPVVVSTGAPGEAINTWYDTSAGVNYDTQFFDTDNAGTGLLEAQINTIIAAGDTPVFRGIFWFQGESDAANGTVAQYTDRWNGLLGQLDSDLTAAGLATDYNFVMNTVTNNWGDDINTTLTAITDADSSGILFDTQRQPYKPDHPGGDWLHGYDHDLVGQANVELYNSADSADPAWHGGVNTTWDTTTANFLQDWAGSTYTNGDDVQFLGAGAGTVTLSGTIAPGSVTVNSRGDYTFTGASITGTGTLTKDGTGTLTLSAANTYNGGTTVNGGELHLEGGANTLLAGSTLTIDGASSVVRLGPTVNGNNIFGSGALFIQNGGTLTDDTAGNQVHSINNGLTFTNGGTLTSIGGSPQGSWGNYFFGGGDVTVTGNAAATISADELSLHKNGITFTVNDVTSDANTDLTISSVIRNYGANASRLLKGGAGTLTLTGANTYTGATTVSGGELVISGTAAAVNSYQSATTVANGATLSFSSTGNIINNQTGRSIVLQDGSTLQNLSSDRFIVFNTAGGGTTVDTGASVTINHESNAGGTGFYLDDGLKGSGTVTINATNAGTGVNLRNNNSTFAGTLIVNGIASATEGAGSGIGVAGNTTGLQNADIQLNGTMELQRTANDNLAISWANTAGGAGNTFQMGALSGTGVMVGNHRTAGGTASVTLGNTNNDGTFSGEIADGVNNTTSITKTGSGTQTFSGANTYSGTTTVNAGTLSLASGSSHSGSGAYTVNGGTLEIATGVNLSNHAMTISLGGVISPGNSPGTAITGAQTWEDGGSYLWEINDAGGTKGADPGWDWLSITGTLNLTNLTAGGFTIDITSLTTANDPGLAAGFDYSGLAYGDPFGTTFIIASADTIDGFDASLFTLDDSAFVNGKLDWSIIESGTDLVLTAVFVPEPSSAALLGLGALALALRRRRA